MKSNEIIKYQYNLIYIIFQQELLEASGKNLSLDSALDEAQRKIHNQQQQLFEGQF